MLKKTCLPIGVAMAALFAPAANATIGIEEVHEPGSQQKAGDESPVWFHGLPPGAFPTRAEVRYREGVAAVM